MNLANLLGPGQLGPAGTIPTKVAHLKRFPFLFLIDVSGSTAMGPDPDIVHINAALAALLDNLHYPSPSSELGKRQAQIDVCVIAYNDAPTTVLPWTCANALQSIQNLSGAGSTRTGAALNHAINEIWTQLQAYGGVGTPCGMPHIIHLTDGQPTDMSIGDPLWNTLKDRLTRLDGTQREKAYARLINFISPRGLMALASTTGAALPGQDIIAALSGPNTVHPMGSGVGKFEDLVKMITLIVTHISHGIDTQQAVEDATKNVNDSNGAP